MKKIILIALISVIAWQGYAKYQGHRPAEARTPVSSQETPPATLPVTSEVGEALRPPTPDAVPAASPSFACDGRTYCSQMSSCEEATFFLNNCPGVKMDGDHDGIPCEQQWCS